jgi:formylglycine-generating enzyme required for sulfatase activity
LRLVLDSPAAGVGLVPERLRVQCGGERSIEFVLVRPGELTRADVRVGIVRPYYVAAVPLTQAQHAHFTGDHSSTSGESADHPVTISWEGWEEFQAQFARRTGRAVRLPSESEWEFACRAGAAGRYCFGDDAGRLDDYAWFGENSGRRLQPVGRKKSNRWGLHDCHGLVWEWCADLWATDFDGAPTDGSPRTDGPLRVTRGGLAGRSFRGWAKASPLVGFRPAISVGINSLSEAVARPVGTPTRGI